MESKIFNIKIDNKELRVDVNNLAARADGSVFVSFGGTTVLATCVMGKHDVDLGYFPLSVNYEEKFYAGGKILGSRFMRREGRPSDTAVLTSRLIDRTIRPLFPKGIKREVQIVVTLLSWDEETDPATLGIFATSLALLISDIPWNGPVAGVRIGKQDNFIAFPNYKQKKEMDLIVSGLKDIDNSIIFNMFEAQFNIVKEEDAIKAVSFAKGYIKQLIDFQEEIQREVGKQKLVFEEKEKDLEVEEKILEKFGQRFETEIENDDLHIEIKKYLKEVFEDGDRVKYGMDFVEKQLENALHTLVLNKGIRPDKRGVDDIRPLNAHIDFVDRVHGCGVFERGQTKALSILTLGGPGQEQLIEGVEFSGKKRFMHHYNFPSFSVGDTRPSRGPSRRDIGHGRLGEKALEPVIPNMEDFPYVIRIVSEVLSSNGSSSMASTCGACLALMAGGVPIKEPVAGIAIGIIVEMDDKKAIKDRDYRVLTDIQGSEDHFGDMDFKVAGTKNGITVIQMDVKFKGLTEEVFEKGLEKARIAREKILDVITETISSPRKELSPYAPSVQMIKINPEKIGDVIGPQGKIINEIIDECDVTIEIEDTGEIFITAINAKNMEKAINWINDLTEEVEMGKIYEGEVKKILDFGAFVEILPGKDGMVHISELDDKRVEKVEDVLKIGDKIKVKVISIDKQGRISLSLKKAK